MKRVDLHTHSWYSDGTASPAEVAARAKAATLDLLFLTDHDSVSAAAELLEACRKEGVDGRCGIEINSRESDQVHILGYGLRWREPAFAERLAAWRERRRERVRRVLERLKSCGVELNWEDIRAQSRESLGRPHVADALKKKGVVKSRKEAFDRFLSRGKPGYVEPMGPGVEEAVELIRGFGGFASLAHPQTVSKLESRLEGWIGAGLEAIEVYYGAHSPAEARRYGELAQSRGLLATGGSDFHGPRTGRDGALGVSVPDEDFARFMERLSRCA